MHLSYLLRKFRFDAKKGKNSNRKIDGEEFMNQTFTIRKN